MSHTKGKCEVVHTNWRTSLLVFGGRIMAECNVDPDFDEDNASDVEAEDAEMEKTANAERIAALWNAAEDIGSTTKEIEDGVIQFAFELGERRAEVINAAKERIEKLEAEKAAIIQVLGEAVYGYQAWRGDIEVIDPIMTRGQRFLEGLEKNGSSPAFVHVEKFEAIVQVLKEIVLLYSCGAIGVLPNGITAPDGSDEGIVKGTPIVEKLMADAEAAIGREEE